MFAFENMWLHAIDTFVGMLVLRMLFGWLVSYRRLMRLILVLLGLAVLIIAIWLLRLPFSQILVFSLILPFTLLLLLSCLPEFAQIYRSATGGQLFALRQSEIEEALPQVCSALMEMVRKRTGGIIVFPKEDDVDDLISGGEEVQANLNKTLVLSIFDPGAPRHDGAMIINGNRIERIGAVLPLASAEGANPLWGTRHLAAIGLSEKCDAEIFVVSEERGTLSHVQDGQLNEIEYDTEQDLIRELADILELDRESESVRRRQYISAGLWLLAGMAAGIGSISVGPVQQALFPTETETTTVEATISFLNEPEGCFVANASVNAVRVTLQGKDAVDSDALGPLKVSVDLTGREPGADLIRLPFQQDMVRNLPRDWEVRAFEPPQIEFVLARAVVLDIPVEANLVGLTNTLRVVAASVTPPSIRATIRDINWRPESSKLLTQPINLSTLQDPGTNGNRTNIYPVKIDIPASIVPARGLNENVQVKVITAWKRPK